MRKLVGGESVLFSQCSLAILFFFESGMRNLGELRFRRTAAEQGTVVRGWTDRLSLR